jgi:hypothetical protein
MRIRSIKPEFFQDEDLAECSLQARFLFAGLWGLADVEGKIKGTAKFAKAQIFPYDDYTGADVDGWLNELANHPKKFILRYEVDGTNYILVRNLNKHQRFDPREKPKGLPNPPKNNVHTMTSHCSTNDNTVTSHTQNNDKSLDNQCAIGMGNGILVNGDLDLGEIDQREKLASTQSARVREKNFQDDEFIAKAAKDGWEYAKESGNTKMARFAWVENFLKTEFKQLRRDKPHIHLLELLQVWRETCDKAVVDGAAKPGWYHTTFRGKVDAWKIKDLGGRPAQKPKIHPVFAAWKAGSSLKFKYTGEIVSPERLEIVKPMKGSPASAFYLTQSDGSKYGCPLVFHEFEPVEAV